MESINSFVAIATYIVGILTVVGTIVVALIRGRRSPLDSVAVGAETIIKLTDSIDKLNGRIKELQDQRIIDIIDFETKLNALKAEYEAVIEKLEEEHEKEVADLRARIKELEEKLKRYEAANGDGNGTNN